MTWRSVIICSVVSLSFSVNRYFFAILSVSRIGILTYRSLISNVISLWFASIFRFIRSLASVVESLTLYWFCKFKRLFGFSLAFFILSKFVH